MLNFIRQVRARFLRWWGRRNRATQSLPRYILATIRNFGRYGSSYSAALAYYAIFSLFPFTLLIAIFVNRVVGMTVAQDQIAQGLAFFLPSDAVSLLQENVLTAIGQGGQFTIVALIGLVWSGLGLFSNLTKTIEFIFHTPAARNIWQQRVTAILMALFLLALIIISFVTSGLLRLFATFFAGSQFNWLSLAVILVPYSVNLLIFVLLLRFVPRVRVHWEAIWTAALFGAAGWELSKAIFVWYLENVANYAVVYGSIATVIVLLLSTYLTSSIVVFCAELCAQINLWYDENFGVQRILLPRRPRRLPPSTPENG